MEYRPHTYQAKATEFIKRIPTCALLLDCGLGKTVITLTAIEELGLHNVLVVAPKLVCGTWEREVNKWDHLEGLTVATAEGTAAKRTAKILEPADIHIISRDNIAWLKKSGLVDLNSYDMIVMDESSSFKNWSAARTKALMDLPSPRKVILTGTPMPKNIQDLFAQYKILDGGLRLESTITAFRGKYMRLVDPARYIYKPLRGADVTVFSRIRDITMSMRSSELLDLPPITTVHNEAELNESERAVYDTMKRDFCLELAGQDITAVNAGVLTGKLSQIANGFVYDEFGNARELHHRKEEVIEPVLEASAGQGEDVIVGYTFKEDRVRLEALCHKLGLPCFDLKSREAIDAFLSPNTGNVGRVALIHPKSAGFGLNLQENCHRLIWYSLPWSYEEFVQTTARVYRQGQQRHTYIHIIETKNSIDQTIRAAINSKGRCNDTLKDQTKYMIEEVQSYVQQPRQTHGQI